MQGRQGPPAGARKVPGFKVWMTEDGVPYGADGQRKATWQNRGNTNTNAPRDSGGRIVRSVPKMMQETWLPPKPEGCHLTHADGDFENNAASNLVWRPRKKRREYVLAWREKKMRQLADPDHPAHGTRLAYDAGCRCSKCKAAARVNHRIYETRKTIRMVEDL